MKKYDACIFDLDGTLVDSLGDLSACCNEALQLYELPAHDIEAYRLFVGNGIKNLIKQSMGDKADDPKLFFCVHEAFTLLYNEKCLDRTKPYEGICELLSKLKAQNVKIGVLSNKADEFAKRIVDELFDKGLIDSVWGKKESYPTKPEPDSLLELIRELDCDKDNCLYIGDSDVDVKTAKNADMDFCGVEWGYRAIDELISSGAKITVKSPMDIYGIVYANE